LLVPDDAGVRTVLRATRRRMAIHAEDEDRLRERKPVFMEPGRPSRIRSGATRRRLFGHAAVLSLATESRRLVHVLHVTTAEEMDPGAYREVASVEVTPQHLTLEAPDCYEQLSPSPR
jgi:dihydroorotase